MTDEWFNEFLYQIVVPKSMLSEDLVRVVDEDEVRGRRPGLRLTWSAALSPSFVDYLISMPFLSFPRSSSFLHGTPWGLWRRPRT
jgi:hypothetical protein